jgi:hypothetical protein
LDIEEYQRKYSKKKINILRAYFKTKMNGRKDEMLKFRDLGDRVGYKSTKYCDM